MDSIAESAPISGSKIQIDEQSWWSPYVQLPQRSSAQPIHLSLNETLYLALANSQQIQVYSDVPLIRETTVREASANFDWTRFAETRWNDTSEPVGSTLTVGGAGNRFNDHKYISSAGVRRKTVTGGEVGIAQRIGWEDNNSNFFIPDNQATTQMTLDFKQPLLRGRGIVYNRSLIVLAVIDVRTARDEFSRQLQLHLLEVVRAYWAIYLERSLLTQRVKLFRITQGILREIEARQGIDAQQFQLIAARAALENRRAELIRSQASVQNAETKLRALVNAAQLGSDQSTEILPLDILTFTPLETDKAAEVAIAVQNRPEIGVAIKGIKAACVRLEMAQNEILPQLNLITQAYVSGLQGNSDFGRAWTSQFDTGAPSYSIGLAYEVPFGNRAAQARSDRRKIEIRQLNSQYRTVLENLNAEVDIALRELDTCYKELDAKHRALKAAVSEAAALESRWKMVVNGNGTAALNLESLLRAQERVTQAENQLITSQLTYQLAISNLYRVNGTLLTVENVDVNQVCENGIRKTVLDKRPPNLPSDFIDSERK